MMDTLGLFGGLVAHYSVDGRYRGNVIRIADIVCQKTVPNFPGKHSWVRLLVVSYCVHNTGGCHLGLGATDDPRPDAASFVVSVWRKKEE